MAIEITVIEPQDLDSFVALVELFAEVFEWEDFTLPTRAYLQSILAKSDFMALVARENDSIIGGLTVYTIAQYYTPKPLAYLYDFAVQSAHQRRGVGKALIAELQAICRAKGFEDVYVQADKEDTHALDFYRATGGVEMHVSHFTYRLVENSDNDM